MTPFLFRVAKAFYNEYQQDISHFTFVFPNKRAGLFFQKYLSEIIESPVFSPEVVAVNELFNAASTQLPADKTELLFRLYVIFRQISKREETFDVFAGWGEMLINDFDEVDRYLVDVEQLFTNVTELKEIDRLFNVFSEEQVKALQQFWEHFLPVTEKKTQEDFIAVWRVLYPIYKQLRADLTQANLGTDAMICRNVVTRLENYEEITFFLHKQFVFVGFNALNPCEKKLFEQLLKRNQADFYWDYEGEQLTDEDNPASMFCRENLKLFPSKLNIEKEDNPLKNKIFELISVPSSVGQAKETCRLLDKLYPANGECKNWTETAVVLPDENLLLPMLYSLPAQIEKVNVTMGFPIKSTPVSAFVEYLFELQRRKRNVSGGVAYYYQTVQNILHHPYIQLLCREDARLMSKKIIEENKIFVEQDAFSFNSFSSDVFNACDHSGAFLDYLLHILKNLYLEVKKISDKNKKVEIDKDFLYEYYTTLNRLKDILSKSPDDIEISVDTMVRIIKQLTSGLTIPFEGEPLEGVQIMGTLETRGLDFENVIICSFNEGLFPNKSNSNSFIPYNLRRAFALPTIENRDAIASYNFYRLIQRAKRIFFLYDTRIDAGQTGEMSRFAYQLEYHYGVKLALKNLAFDIRFPTNKSIEVHKTPDVMEKLMRFTAQTGDAKAFSASSLNNYIDCPLKFYFSQIERVEEADEVAENIEANMFGTLLHRVMQDIYLPLEGKVVNASHIDTVLNNPLYIGKLVRIAFSEIFQKKEYRNSVGRKLFADSKSDRKIHSSGTGLRQNKNAVYLSCFGKNGTNFACSFRWRIFG
ncbi:MAG: PD-(D/E)XK nuclease family protein [Paludibacteraceae bacterium]